METFLRILEITIPSLIVFCAAFIMIKKFFSESEKKKDEETMNLIKIFFENEEKKRRLTTAIENAKITVPLRIQAYERLTLLLERINPESLLIRVVTPQMTASLLHQELLITIRAEFEHNLSQQIYVSHESWNTVRQAKDWLVKIINEESEKVAAVAPASALSEAILIAIVKQEVTPIQTALNTLKREVENYM